MVGAVIYSVVGQGLKAIERLMVSTKYFRAPSPPCLEIYQCTVGPVKGRPREVACGFNHAFSAKMKGIMPDCTTGQRPEKRVFPLPKKFSIFKGKHPLKTIL
jgi:hypothetical protein